MRSRHNPRTLYFHSPSEAGAELQKVGVDPAATPPMVQKLFGQTIKLEAVQYPAVNILKQEMLSLGGDAAVAREVITGQVETSDVILVGTVSQLEQLVRRISGRPFGLAQVAEELEELLQVMSHPPRFSLDCRGHRLDLSARTHVMGVLNVTPDSFSDGGKYFNLRDAVQRARQMVAEGADLIDVGGESTRPGSLPITPSEEIDRVVPVVEELTQTLDVPISVDTYKSEVARWALEAGVHLINDISGLRFDPEMAGVVAEYGVPVVIMHIKGTPRNMQKNPIYQDLLSEITAYLREGVELAIAAGISGEQVIVDPGIGFGKTVQHNLEIIRRLGELASLGQPILIGPSRKSFIGQVLELPVEERLEGTAAAVALSVANGAHMVRVHDVRQMVRVVRLVDAIQGRWPRGQANEGS